MFIVHPVFIPLFVWLYRWELWIRSSLFPYQPLSSNQIEELRVRDSVPEDLVPFLDTVNQWGAPRSELEGLVLAEYVDARPRLKQKLEEFHQAWTPDLQKKHHRWRSRLENDTALKFDFAIGLLWDLGFKFQQPDRDEGDRVAELIDDLTRPGIARMQAAMSLPDYEEEAVVAIPHLTTVLSEQDRIGNIGIHYALARLTGDLATHRAALELIRESAAQDLTQAMASDVLERLNRTPEQHRLAALCGFCILNELKSIERLAGLIDVNNLNHNSLRPLEFAVGHQNAEAVRILLEHGADPNLPNQLGDHALHIAASGRDNGKIISLLVRHGADIAGKDAHGRTPLDIARRSRHDSNVVVLEHFLAAK